MLTQKLFAFVALVCAVTIVTCDPHVRSSPCLGMLIARFARTRQRYRMFFHREVRQVGDRFELQRLAVFPSHCNAARVCMVRWRFREDQPPRLIGTRRRWFSTDRSRIPLSVAARNLRLSRARHTKTRFGWQRDRVHSSGFLPALDRNRFLSQRFLAEPYFAIAIRAVASLKQPEPLSCSVVALL